MYLNLCIGVVNEEVEVLVLDIQHFLIVDIASERNGDIWKIIGLLLRQINIKELPVLLERLRTIDTEYGSAALVILGSIVKG